jgi:two-component system sensor kinase
MGLTSAHTPSVHAVAREAESVLVVSDYVPGRSLESELRSRQRLSLEESLTVVHCMLRALRDIHGRDVLHRDVRPANLIIRDSHLSDVSLVDFGPTRSWDTERLSKKHAGDLAWFLSPEQAGSIDQDISPASDLYSAGVVFFYCLTGTSPFVGKNVGEVLLSHMTTPVPKLRELGIDVPRSVDEMIQRLLRKDPRDRFQTAQAVLADLDAISQSRTGDSTHAIVIGSRDGRRTLTEPSFVGRETELQTIDQCLRATAQGSRKLVLVESESGGGKTRFLTEVLQRAACAGFRVFRGNCSSQVGQSGLTLFDGVVDGLMAIGQSDAHLIGRLRNWPAADLDTLTSTLPELRSLVKRNDTQTSLPEEFVEEPKLQVLQRFLNELGSADRPALVIWDDCQWADEFTFKLMQRWSKRWL